jgi:hypothetical protein
MEGQMNQRPFATLERSPQQRRIALLVVLLFLIPACALPGAASVDTQATSIALGVQASEIAAQATALEIQKQALTVTPTQPPPPTVDTQATAQAEQATAQAVEQTRNAPVLPSDTPLPQATATSPVAEQEVSLTAWQTVYWAILNSGCQIKAAPCWKLFDDYKTTQGQAIAFLTSKEEVLIGENWNRPHLVYLNKRELRYEAKVTLIVDGKPVDVRIIPKGSVQIWTEEAIDLSNYKGKNVKVQFSCPVGMPRINSWFIQNVRIVPDYQP